MKSVFITFIIFIVVFALLKAGIISVISSSVFHYLVYGLFIIVIIVAIRLIGLPTAKKSEDEKNEDKK